MVNKLLVVTGILTFVLVTAAVAAQLAYAHEPECALREFDCAVERDGDTVRVSVDVDAQDVRLTVRGDCVAEPAFSAKGGSVLVEATCPHNQPRVSLDVAVLYTVDGTRTAATGRVVA